MKRFSVLCICAGMLVLLAACKGGVPGNPSPVPTGPSASPSPTPTPYMGPRIGAYNFATTATTITTYPLLANGATNPVQLITGSATGLGLGYVGIAFDGSGNIYTGVGVGGTPTTILVFASAANQNAAPARTMTLPFSAIGIAMDGTGNFFTINAANGSLNRFPAAGSGAVAPTASFQPVLRTPSGFLAALASAAATGSGDVYCGCAVFSGGTFSVAGVSIYSVSAGGAPRLITSFYDRHLSHPPVAVAVDTAGKIAYVGEIIGGVPIIFAYATTDSGLATATRIIAGPNTGMQSIDGLAVGSDRELYVADGAGHRIEVFADNASGNATANRVITDTNLQFGPFGNTIALH